MRNKITLILLLIPGLLLMVYGCTGGTDQGETPVATEAQEATEVTPTEEAEEEPTDEPTMVSPDETGGIGLLLGQEDSIYFQAVTKGAQEAAEVFGVSLTILYSFEQAEQASQMQGLIESGSDALLVYPFDCSEPAEVNTAEIPFFALGCAPPIRW
jgi:ABC-type sugar transport system substrate-binding protein